MKKNIWHNAKECTPEIYRKFMFVKSNITHIGPNTRNDYFGFNFLENTDKWPSFAWAMYSDDFVRNLEFRWAYVDDLINLEELNEMG